MILKITLKTKKRSEMIDITDELQSLLDKKFNGICNLFCIHTTAGLCVNENADPDVKHDVIQALDKLLPWNDIAYKHMEGNSAAHIKSILTGVDLSLSVTNGILDLGQWQSVYFCEYDGPRERHVIVRLISDAGKPESEIGVR